MKIYNLISIFVFILLLSVSYVNAEVYLWDSVTVLNSSSIVKYHAFYWFDDTSPSGIGRNKDIPITFVADIEGLPYNLSFYNGTVDYCNFTINHFINEYDSTGDLVNTTNKIYNYYYESMPFNTTIKTVKIRSRDSITADMDCHYTNPNTLYVENLLVGRFTTYMPSFECNGCTDFSLEELTQQIESNQNITDNEITIYENVQKVVGFNYQLWTILVWVARFFFLVLGLILIYTSIYYFYQMIKDLAREI